MRTQPCDAGYAGTEGDPWMAIPPLKYCGLYSEPRGPVSHPECWAYTVYDPGGVTATRHHPSEQNRSLEPVDTFRIVSRVLPSYRNRTWRSRSTSTRVTPPAGTMGG